MTLDQTRLGSSGLEVSRLALGCMSFGDPARGSGWELDDEAAAPLFKQAVELGITFWDTANVYSSGSSEEVVGRAIKEYGGGREQVVLATKVYFPMHEGAGGSGLSRKAILEQVDASLTRLGTDYVDLYQIHRFDPDVPVEETMEALHDVVKAGKVRYLGASSMWAWQLLKMQEAARANGWTEFVSMQNQYNLMQREDEREMYPLLEDLGMGSMPWSPLARGFLTRPFDETTTRSGTDRGASRHNTERDRPIADAVQQVAEARGVPMAQVAMAWVLRNPLVDAPIIGATKATHLLDAVAAFDLDLSDGEVEQLEAAYSPRLPAGFV